MPNKTNKKGFTLIEIVIVLAIAALIMVVVFLAVQGAQRGQRDQARKDTTNRVLSQVQSWSGNNGGKQIASTDLGQFCKDYLGAANTNNATTAGNGCVKINGQDTQLVFAATATVDAAAWTGTCTFGTTEVNQISVGYGATGSLKGHVCLEANSFYNAP